MEDADQKSEESPIKLAKKKTTQPKVDKVKDCSEPENFEEYAKQSILKRKKVERLSFERENFVMKKLHETNIKIHFHHSQMGKINSSQHLQKAIKLQKEKEKINHLILRMRYFYTEMNLIKENLKDFYNQIRE
jgi:hypothetical protein